MSRVSPFAFSRAQSLRMASSSSARVLGERLRRFFQDEGRQEDALHVVHHQQGRPARQRALDGLDGFFQVVERGDGVVFSNELAAEGIEHRGDVAVRLDGDERGAVDLLRANHPAGELCGERGLAFAALAAHDGVACISLPPQQPLEREQLPAAPDEAGCPVLAAVCRGVLRARSQNPPGSASRAWS